jgi:hypothetical protein
MSSRRVLLIGLDPHGVPGVDAKLVDTAIAASNARFATASIEHDTCLFPPDVAAATEQVTAALTTKPYECVVIGGGLRKPDDLVALFEIVVDLIRRHAPRATIAFNTNPVTSLDAALRGLRLGESL